MDTISINSKNDGQSYYYNSQANPNAWLNRDYSINTYGAINSIYNQKTGIEGAAGAIQGYTAWNAGDVSFTWYKAGAGFTPLGQANKGDTTGYDIIINALPANQTKFGEAYIFGDSLSDIGTVFDASYGNIPKGVYMNGRWTNGLNWVDQLQKATGLPVLDFAFGGADISDMVVENKVEKKYLMIAGTSGVPRTPSLEQEIFASKGVGDKVYSDFNNNVPATTKKTTTTPQLFNGPSAYRYIAAGLSSCKQIAILVLMGANDFWHHFHANNPADSAVQIFAGTLAQTEIGDLTQINLNLMSVASQVKYPIPECKGKLNLPQIYVLGLPNIGLAPSYNNAPEAQKFSIYLDNGLQAAIRNYDLANPNYNNLHFIPLYDFVQAIVANPTLFDYSTESISDPRDASIFGTWSTDYPTHANDANFMGLQGEYEHHHYVVGSLSEHLDIMLYPPLAYRQADINKFIFAGKMHPSAKTHALLSYDIDYWLMQHHFFKDNIDPQNPTDPANYTSQILKWVAENQGMTAKHNAVAFNALLNLANQASQPRPSFTSQIATTLNQPLTLAPNINGPAALSSSGKQVVAMWVVDQQGVKTLYSQGGQLNTPSGTVTWLGKPTLVAKNASHPAVAIIPGSTHMVAVWVTKAGTLAYADGNNGNFWHVAAALPLSNLFGAGDTSPSISIDKKGNVLVAWVSTKLVNLGHFIVGKLIDGGKSVLWNKASHILQGGNVTAISSLILPEERLVEFWTDNHYNLFYRFGTLSNSRITWNGAVNKVTVPQVLANVGEPTVKWVGEQNGQPLLAVIWRDNAHNKIDLNYATITGTKLNFKPTMESVGDLVYSPAIAFSTIGSSIYSIIGGAAEQQTTVKKQANKVSTITTYPYQVSAGPLTINSWPESLASIPTYLRMQRER